MPELPEVEVTRQGLDKALSGDMIEQVKVFTNWARIPLMFTEDVAGKTIQRVVRHGKYLFFDLGDQYLMSHLGMSGSFRIGDSKARKAYKHDHYGMRTDKNIVYYNDPRRFGRIDIVDRDLLPELDNKKKALLGVKLYNLGPDALNHILIDGESDEARRLWKTRLKVASANMAIKTLLLQQTVIAGIGNIYASEILFYARINPAIRNSALTTYGINRIAKFSSKVLRLAIKNGGTAFPGANQFEDTGGNLGKHFDAVSVYAREGQPCKACGTTIKKSKQDGRSTFWCPKCQPI